MFCLDIVDLLIDIWSKFVEVESKSVISLPVLQMSDKRSYLLMISSSLFSSRYKIDNFHFIDTLPFIHGLENDFTIDGAVDKLVQRKIRFQHPI